MEYDVVVSIPCTNNRWKANVEKRQIEAGNLNQVIMKALSVEEYKHGARITEVWELSTERGILSKRIV